MASTSGSTGNSDVDQDGAVDVSSSRSSGRHGVATSSVGTRNAENDLAPKLRYEMRHMVTEDHKSPIFCVQFNKFVAEPVFVCVAKNRVSLYECEPNGKFKYLQVFVDPDEKEQFFTCAWSAIHFQTTVESVVAVAGIRGVIRIVRPKTMTCLNTGDMKHPAEINELKFHPTKRQLLVSASKDHTLKLWNVETCVLIAVFGGPDAHRDSVLSAAFNLNGSLLVSCGMDHAIKFWDIDTEAIECAIKESENFNALRSLRSFSTVQIDYPCYTTREIHPHYIDCIQWFGSLLISKSNDNKIVVWKPDMTTEAKPSLFHEIKCDHCALWFLKFSVDSSMKILTLGNTAGKVFVWNLDTSDPRHISCTTLTHARSTSTIRHTALSANGAILIAVSDDGKIWRWDRVLGSTKTVK